MPVEPHNKHFSANSVPDDVWLPEVGRQGWIVLTHDKKFNSNASERAAVVQHEVGVFVLWGADATLWERVRFLAKVWDKLLDKAAHERRPFIWSFSRSGAAKRILP